MTAQAQPSGKDPTPALKVLEAAHHFSTLPMDVKDSLARQMIPRVYEPGNVICLEGDKGEYIYFVEKGWVKSVRTATDGREQAALFLHDGEIIGSEAVFTAGTYELTSITLEKVYTWAVPAGVLKVLVTRNPPLAMVFLELLGARVNYYIQLVEDLGLRSVQARIAHTLLDHVEIKDGMLVVPRRPWTTLDAMAARLGTVRDVLKRALNVFEADGVLRLEHNRIVILDAQKLVERGKA